MRHRQTKGAETDMFDLQPPRHISTLRSAGILAWRREGLKCAESGHLRTPERTGMVHPKLAFGASACLSSCLHQGGQGCRQCCRSSRPVDRLVQRMRPSGRARSRRDGCPGMEPKHPSSIGASGWPVPAAAAGRSIWWRAAPSGGALPLACAHRRQNQSRNARRSLRLRRAIARYRASNAANEQHHPGPGDHH
jgi:hypothetical protein